MRYVFLTIAAVLMTTGTADADPANDAAAKPAGEKVCKREMRTGSRFATKVCRTRAEIEARAETDHRTMNEARLQANVTMRPN